MEKTANLESTNTAEKPLSPPERVANFIRRVIRGEKFYPGAERRINLRYPVTMPVRATPVNEDHVVDGEPFLGVTRDISVGGLCMYHLDRVSSPYLQIELTHHHDSKDELKVVMEVVRCRKTGPLYEIAGRFVGFA
jgi:PilZ domain